MRFMKSLKSQSVIQTPCHSIKLKLCDYVLSTFVMQLTGRGRGWGDTASYTYYTPDPGCSKD